MRAHATPCIVASHSWLEPGIYPGLVLELSSLDLEEIADALADQTDYEHRWLINPKTREIVFWTAAGDPPVQALSGVPAVLGRGRVLPDLRS